jgi:hypothetical protein
MRHLCISSLLKARDFMLNTENSLSSKCCWDLAELKTCLEIPAVTEEFAL